MPHSTTTMGAVFSAYEMDQKLVEWCEGREVVPVRSKRWTIRLMAGCAEYRIRAWRGDLPEYISEEVQGMGVVRFKRGVVREEEGLAHYLATLPGEEAPDA